MIKRIVENWMTRTRLLVTLALVTGGVCGTAMLLAVIVYGPPVNTEWWAVMAATLTAAFISPFVIIPVIEWIVDSTGGDPSGEQAPMPRREALLGLSALILSAGGTYYGLKHLFQEHQVPLKQRDPLLKYSEPWPRLPPPPNSSLSWSERSPVLRNRVRGVLTIPNEQVDLSPTVHRRNERDGYVVESISYASEPDSRVTALLYVPERGLPAPAVTIAAGHGNSKSTPYSQYAGQLYAKMGFLCLVPDTIGEEERHIMGKMGTPAHDMDWLTVPYPRFVRDRLKRMVMGKLAWDLMRGLEYLKVRDEVKSDSLGIAGFSGGALATACVSVLDRSVDAAVICGWSFRENLKHIGRFCTRMSWTEIPRYVTGEEATALAAENTATLYMIGDSEEMLDPKEDGRGLVRDLSQDVEGARQILNRAGIEYVIDMNIAEGGDHRSLFLTAPSVSWLQEQLMSPKERRALPREIVKFGDWVDSQGLRIEPLYNTEARLRGTRCVDVGARFDDPKLLACFPDTRLPPSHYTMEGWIQSQLARNSKT